MVKHKSEPTLNLANPGTPSSPTVKKDRQTKATAGLVFVDLRHRCLVTERHRPNLDYEETWLGNSVIGVFSIATSDYRRVY